MPAKLARGLGSHALGLAGVISQIHQKRAGCTTRSQNNWSRTHPYFSLSSRRPSSPTMVPVHECCFSLGTIKRPLSWFRILGVKVGRLAAHLRATRGRGLLPMPITCDTTPDHRVQRRLHVLRSTPQRGPLFVAFVPSFARNPLLRDQSFACCRTLPWPQAGQTPSPTPAPY